MIFLDIFDYVAPLFTEAIFPHLKRKPLIPAKSFSTVHRALQDGLRNTVTHRLKIRSLRRTAARSALTAASAEAPFMSFFIIITE